MPDAADVRWTSLAAVSGSSSSPTPRRALALGLVAVCALMAVLLAGRRSDEVALRAANEAGSAGRLQQAIDLARPLEDSAVAADAFVVEATAAFALSRFAQARTALVAALELRPNDWRAWRDLTSVELLLGDREAARRAEARARGLNPRIPPVEVFRPAR